MSAQAGYLCTDDGKPIRKKGPDTTMHNEINKAIMADLRMTTLTTAGSEPLADLRSEYDPNWRSQKTARKRVRYLSNAPKATKRRLGFKERRG